MTPEPYSPPTDLIGADASEFAARLVAIYEAAGFSSDKLRLAIEAASWAFGGE